MFTFDTLLQNILDHGFNFTEDALNEISLCKNIPSLFMVLINNLELNDDNIQYINTTMIMTLSSLNKDYINCCSFIIDGKNSLWNYVIEYFDDSQLSTLVISLYLCIMNTNIKVEYILKLYGILFSNYRSCEILTEMETFYDDKSKGYVNNYNTFLGIIMNKISVSETNYDSRVKKLFEIFMKLLKNGEVKPIFLNWFGKLINSSKHFKNNMVFDEHYDRNMMHPKYYRLVINILLELWNNCKKQSRCKIENLDMEYFTHKNCLINLDDRVRKDKIENKFMNDIFFSLIGLISLFYNNLEFMSNQYKTAIDDLKISFRRFQLTGFNPVLRDKYLDKITKIQLEKEDIEYCLSNKNLNLELKRFQKDLGDIINSKLKQNIKINHSLLETNIDLINTLKIYEDSLFNYNFINFENSVILINYKYMRNPFIRYKYSFFSTNYITDNKSRNVCDLRFKTIENILIPNLLKFYLDMEDYQEDSFYEKPFARWNIINFMNFIVFKEPYIYGCQIGKYAKTLDTKFIRFVNLYINDLSGFFDETFGMIREVNEIEKNEIYISFNELEDAYHNSEQHLKLYKIYKSLKTNLEFLRSMFNFLVVLTNESKNILLSQELGEKYCSQINYYLNEITSKEKRKLYNVKNKYDVGFQPLNLLDFLTKILLSCLDNHKFIEYMAKDERSYSSYNIKFAITKLWNNQLITRTEYLKLEKMYKQVDDKIKMEEEEVDLPDEFCDPLMACEIKEPVMLPDTDIIMEKSVISRHLLTDLHNPFNREPLTLEKLNSFNSKLKVKETLKLFIDKKEAWKNEYG